MRRAFHAIRDGPAQLFSIAQVSGCWSSDFADDRARGTRGRSGTRTGDGFCQIEPGSTAAATLSWPKMVPSSPGRFVSRSNSDSAARCTTSICSASSGGNFPSHAGSIARMRLAIGGCVAKSPKSGSLTPFPKNMWLACSGLWAIECTSHSCNGQSSAERRKGLPDCA